MQDRSDAELLHDYAGRGQETAFRELVTRHADLVFSAALRQVNSPDLASDITQEVFLDLARKARTVAGRLTAGGTLAGWLFRSTRYAALNHMRDDRLRVEHERQAMEQLLTNTSPAPDWERV
ncbi:MAG TPA: sigma factor, partial [Candidatus Cybelea sp.]|nr:sigma factor [Candidatus Cybelea sp.]